MPRSKAVQQEYPVLVATMSGQYTILEQKLPEQAATSSWSSSLKESSTQFDFASLLSDVPLIVIAAVS